MNNEQQKQSKKLYRLIEGNMEAVAYVIWKNGMVIDEELYKALPNRLKKAFTDIMPKEIINPSNMSEEIQNGAVETGTPNTVAVDIPDSGTETYAETPVAPEATESNAETVEVAE